MQANDDADRGSDRRREDRRKEQTPDLPFPDRRSGTDRRSGVDRRRDQRHNPA
jgi:hypothetical protein